MAFLAPLAEGRAGRLKVRLATPLAEGRAGRLKLLSAPLAERRAVSRGDTVFDAPGGGAREVFTLHV